MAPIAPNPSAIRRFRTAEAFESWLRSNHERETEIWIRIYKKATRARKVAQLVEMLARGETIVPESRRKQ